jgi:hypothetical protein
MIIYTLHSVAICLLPLVSGLFISADSQYGAVMAVTGIATVITYASLMVLSSINVSGLLFWTT